MHGIRNRKEAHAFLLSFEKRSSLNSLIPWLYRLDHFGSILPATIAVIQSHVAVS